jgi:glucose/arabinose dehydrogenase
MVISFHPVVCSTHRIPSWSGWLVFASVMMQAGSVLGQASEADYYRLTTITTSQPASDSRSKTWKPTADTRVLEASGLAFLADGRLAVATRKGDVWLLSQLDAQSPAEVVYQRFATGLHEPLGLIEHQGTLLVMQRAELTRLIDRDGDDICDEYQTVATGWGVTGNYHEYAFGPEVDREGQLWLTLNLGLGLKGEQKARAIRHPGLGVEQARWRGWGMVVTPEGKLQPMCAGMRSPSGLGTNLDGEPFYTDQQGNWVATNSLHHLRHGVFFHHPESLASVDEPLSTISPPASIPGGLPLPEALKEFPTMKPPAVWFPYKRMGQSATDILVDASRGAFGPFAGQLFVGEFTQASINRVYLEKIDGEYQGACFPFRQGMASAVLRLAQAADGSILVGLSNRGWSSLGAAAYGLQRLVWTGKLPMEIREMRAQPDGFELVFTKPVAASSVGDPAAFHLASHTYLYQSKYGSDEIEHHPVSIHRCEVSADGLRVRLRTEALRPFFVHCLVAAGVRSTDGEPLLHPEAYYTLNHIPAVDR